MSAHEFGQADGSHGSDRDLTGYDFDLLVLGHETEGCLAAIAAARAGGRAAVVLPLGRMLGGLLTEGGLAYVDRDSRHLLPPAESPHDGLFGEFLARAGVPLVALDAQRGRHTLRTMLDQAGVTILHGQWGGIQTSGDRVESVKVAGSHVVARFYLDATPDGDFLEALGEPFSTGFQEYGISRLLGVSPLPVLRGVTPAQIAETCARLAADEDLQELQRRVFGERRFLAFDQGADYLLVGPPHLALAFKRWREKHGSRPPAPFEADGFNVAILAPDVTSWNGLIYFESDLEALLRWSRSGADDAMRQEVALFGRFLRDEMGWSEAEIELPWGMYVRQTRHALRTVLRLSLEMIASGAPVRSIGTFCYYPDFRGFRVTPAERPLVARVALDAGLLRAWRNVGIASRAGGYTPPAHSLCRLVQYNATLGAAIGVAAAIAPGDDLREVRVEAIRDALANLGLLADDPAGLDETPLHAARLLEDPLVRMERARALA